MDESSQDQGGEGQFQENESGVDGQGTKDVSDQIENVKEEEDWTLMIEDDEKEESPHDEIDQLEAEEMTTAPSKKNHSQRGEPQRMDDHQKDDRAADHGIVNIHH